MVRATRGVRLGWDGMASRLVVRWGQGGGTIWEQKVRLLKKTAKTQMIFHFIIVCFSFVPSSCIGSYTL